MFQLSETEFDNLRSRIVTSSWGGRRYLKLAFTEQGIAMLSSVLKSEKAALVNIAILRAFVAMRHFALNFKELAQKIAELETMYDQNFRDINEVLNFLANENQTRAEEIQELQNQPKTGWESRPAIGFKKRKINQIRVERRLCFWAESHGNASNELDSSAMKYFCFRFPKMRKPSKF